MNANLTLLPVNKMRRSTPFPLNVERFVTALAKFLGPGLKKLAGEGRGRGL